MKSTEFINEAISNTFKEVFEELAQIYDVDMETIMRMLKLIKANGLNATLIEQILQIARDCQPYIHETGVDEAFNLYRGINNGRGDFIEKRVRLDGRTPNGMTQKLYTGINDYFKDMYGHPFRDAMLCTGDYSHAGIFGYQYIVLPKGNFKFLWSEQIDDINYSFSHYLSKDSAELDGISDRWDSNLNQVGELFLKHVIKQIDWHTIDMNSATDSNAEIMIRCNGYYGFSGNMYMEKKDVLADLLRMALGEK